MEKLSALPITRILLPGNRMPIAHRLDADISLHLSYLSIALRSNNLQSDTDQFLTSHDIPTDYIAHDTPAVFIQNVIDGPILEHLYGNMTSRRTWKSYLTTSEVLGIIIYKRLLPELSQQVLDLHTHLL